MMERCKQGVIPWFGPGLQPPKPQTDSTLNPKACFRLVIELVGSAFPKKMNAAALTAYCFRASSGSNQNNVGGLHVGLQTHWVEDSGFLRHG